MCADANGPELTDLLEVQRGVMRVSLKEFKVFICHVTNGIGKTPVVSPDCAVRPDVSHELQRLAAAGLHVLPGFIEQTLQLSGVQVLLDLLVPELRAIRVKPSASSTISAGDNSVIAVSISFMSIGAV
jgi:hypothetical protein